MLGTGLHSYGFGTGGSEWMIAGVVGADLLFVLAATARYKGWFVTDGEPASDVVAATPSPSGN